LFGNRLLSTREATRAAAPTTSPIFDPSVKIRVYPSAARALVEGVVSVFGLNPKGTLTLNSDKGTTYTSRFFQAVCKSLNVRLITSASQISKSNGLAESCVKATKQGLKIFSENDIQLKSSLPIIELSLRAQINTVTELSQFDIVFGRPMCLPIIADDPMNHTNFTGDQTDYFNLISRRLAEIHKGVKHNLDEAKLRDA